MPREECSALIEIDSEYAREIVEAISPDNEEAPQHVKVTCNSHGKFLQCIISVIGCRDPGRLLTLKNTIDDLILAVKSSHEALDKIE